jgi:pimeloyl-ACP methyl ester carboxylesterase
MLKTIEYLDINGTKQCVCIKRNKPGLPILLYLHGGPGDSALPLVAKYNKRLEEIFTVVTLEQRGAGKSYYKFSRLEEITIETYIQDIYVLVNILLDRYNEEKLYIVGHSWGSVLGLHFISRYPQLVHAYVGCGQVVNMKKSSRIAYNFAVKKNEEAGNAMVLERLRAIDPSYSGKHWFDDLMFVTGQVVKHKGSLYGSGNYNRFVFDFITSPDYSFIDLRNRQKGAQQSVRRLWQELMKTNFETIDKFETPVIFIEGLYDYHVSSEVVLDYCDILKSRRQFFWFDQSCHFPQWSEADRFFEVMKTVVNDGYQFSQQHVEL